MRIIICIFILEFIMVDSAKLSLVTDADVPLMVRDLKEELKGNHAVF